MAVHPGSVDTGLTTTFRTTNSWWSEPLYSVIQPLLKTPERGALTQIWAATSQEAKSGTYYVPVAKENAGSGYARDEKLARELWDWTEKEISKHGY